MPKKEFWKPEDKSSGDYWRHIIIILDKNDIIDPDICREIYDFHKLGNEVKYRIPYYDIYKLVSSDLERQYFDSLISTYELYCKYYAEISEHIDYSELRNRHPFVFPEFKSELQFYHYLLFSGNIFSITDELENKWVQNFIDQYLSIIGVLTKCYYDNEPWEIPDSFIDIAVDNDSFQIFMPFLFIAQLYAFRSIVYKTWSGNTEEQGGLNAEETSFITRLYPDIRKGVGYYRVEEGYPTDPFCLEINKTEFITSPEPYIIFECIIKSMIVDYVEEIMDFKRYKAGHSVARCHSCGQFFKYDIYARNQKYCSNQCKWREDKRRQRQRKREEIIKKKRL